MFKSTDPGDMDPVAFTDVKVKAEDVSFDKFGSVLFAATDHLLKMGESRPKNINSLKNALMPVTRGLTVSDPLKVLTHLLENPSFPQKILVKYKYHERIEPQYLKARVAKITKQKCQRSNMKMLMLRIKDSSKLGNQIGKDAISKILRSTQKMDNLPFEKLVVSVTEAFYYIKECRDDDIMEIVKNLSECGIVSLIPSSPMDDVHKVTYNDFPMFMVLCLEELMSRYDKQIADSQEKNRLPLKFKTLIKLANKSIQKLRKCLQTKEPVEFELSAGVDAFLKRTNKRRHDGTLDPQSVKRRRRDSVESEESLVSYPEEGEARSGSESRYGSSGSSSPYRSRSRSRESLVKSTSSCRSNSQSRSRSRSPSWCRGDCPQDRSRSPSPAGAVSVKRRQQDDPSHKPDPVDGLTSRLEKLKTRDDFLAKLCTDFSKLNVEDIKEIPHDLTPESLHVLLALQKMGKSKPKTIASLCKALKHVCRFMYIIPFYEGISKLHIETSHKKKKGMKRESSSGLLHLFSKSKSKELPLQCHQLLMHLNQTPNGRMCKRGLKLNKQKLMRKGRKRKMVVGRLSRRGKQPKINFFTGKVCGPLHRQKAEKKDKGLPFSARAMQKGGQFLKENIEIVLEQKTKKQNAFIIEASDADRYVILKQVSDWIHQIAANQNVQKEASKQGAASCAPQEDQDMMETSIQQATRQNVIPTEREFVQQLMAKCFYYKKISEDLIIQLLQKPCFFENRNGQTVMLGAIDIGRDGSIAYSNLHQAKQVFASYASVVRNKILCGYSAYLPQDDHFKKQDSTH